MKLKCTCGKDIVTDDPAHNRCADCVAPYWEKRKLAVEQFINATSAREPFPSEGRKDDGGKPQWSLLPWAALAGAVRVLTFGAKKYAPDNWKRVPDARRRYTDALFRHFVAWQLGEKTDPETGESHLSHALCCLLFIDALERENG